MKLITVEKEIEKRLRIRQAIKQKIIAAHQEMTPVDSYPITETCMVVKNGKLINRVRTRQTTALEENLRQQLRNVKMGHLVNGGLLGRTGTGNERNVEALHRLAQSL